MGSGLIFFIEEERIGIEDEECEQVPSAYKYVPGVSYHRYPFTIGADYPVTEADIPNTYLAMFADGQNIARILTHIAAAEGAVVFHC